MKQRLTGTRLGKAMDFEAGLMFSHPIVLKCKDLLGWFIWMFLVNSLIVDNYLQQQSCSFLGRRAKKTKLSIQISTNRKHNEK